jgi:hypothetical protein
VGTVDHTNDNSFSPYYSDLSRKGPRGCTQSCVCVVETDRGERAGRGTMAAQPKEWGMTEPMSLDPPTDAVIHPLTHSLISCPQHAVCHFLCWMRPASPHNHCFSLTHTNVCDDVTLARTPVTTHHHHHHHHRRHHYHRPCDVIHPMRVAWRRKEGRGWS